jgi:uncharacterized Rossmann fold enzyme
MDFEEWEGYYSEILDDFGFSKDEDERSALLLSELLENKDLASINELKYLIEGKDILVVGGGRNLEDQLKAGISQEIIIAADGTTSALLNRGLVPDIIVTDLDGNIEDQIEANRKGAVVAIHAHGDNIEAVKLWTPQFQGKIIGTVQCRPFGSLRNFGGFTDGDRGAFLAHHFNAGSIRLMGFDFENVGDKENCNIEVKARKLDWAKKLISYLGITTE